MWGGHFTNLCGHSYLDDHSWHSKTVNRCLTWHVTCIYLLDKVLIATYSCSIIACNYNLEWKVELSVASSGAALNVLQLTARTLCAIAEHWP